MKRTRSVLIFTVVIFLFATCDLFNPAVIDKIKSDSNRTNPIDSGFWERLADFPEPLPKYNLSEQFTIFALDGKLFVGGGRIDNSTSKSRNAFFAYDPISDSWSGIAAYPGTNLFQPLIVSINGEAYLIGGTTDNVSIAVLQEGWKYNPVMDKWTRIADAPADMHTSTGTNAGGTAVVNDGKLYVADLQPFIYDPLTDLWSRAGSIPPSATGTGGLFMNFIRSEPETGMFYYLDDTRTVYIINAKTFDSSAGPVIPASVFDSNTEYFVLGDSLYGRYGMSESSFFSLKINTSGGEPELKILPNGYPDFYSERTSFEEAHRRAFPVGDSIYFIEDGGALYRYKP